ncbi:hypothetical protein KVT40_001037 [Elsinoe batatas]|uniref:Uncharacterized protein n=1 Tax=Elsinoe batatas TaxID=2601811 RepID=A0A8K0L9U1_9PEZI|nr:hypothetical protein KVT40_001037 [Elsinoe batatas]
MAGQVAGEGLLLLEGEEHKQAKKAFAHSFQPQRVNNVYPMFYKMASKMQDWVGQQAKDDPESRASVLKPVSAATLDAVGQWAYSKDFKALSNPRERFPRSYVEMLKMTPRGQFFLSLVALIDPWVMKLPVRAAKTITGVVQFVIKTSAEIVDEREKLFEKNKNGEPDSEIPDDMLSSIMKTNHFSHVELINETVHFLAASTETSAGSICWAVHLLSRHMHVQNRLREEIRTDLPSPKMVHDGLVDEDRVSYKVFDNMPYLHAVAKEVFRFHSINSLLWRECVEPATVAGEDITIGTQVVFSPWAAGRDPKHWGPDARQLRPERWLESPSGGADDSYAFLTFGASARRCIGEQYAYAQFKTFLAALVGKFEFKTMDVTGTDVGTEIGSNYPLTLFKIMDGWKSYVREIDGW